MAPAARRRPEKTAMIIARRIVNDIRRNGHTVGAKLPPERVMLEEYQVGRGTLRESLRFLELQGVISLRPGPGGGPTVEKPTASNLAITLVLLLQFENSPFRDVVEARRGLEPLMARLAAERIRPDQMARLEDSIERMRDHLDDEEIFLEANGQFHDVIAWSSGNALFGFFIDALLNIIDGTALGVDYPPHRRAAVLKAHMRILDALKSGDADASQEAMQAHIDEYVRYVTRKFPNVLAQPVTLDLV